MDFLLESGVCMLLTQPSSLTNMPSLCDGKPTPPSAYLGDHVLHEPRVQLERPLAAPALRVDRDIVAAVTSISIDVSRPRAGVFWAAQQSGMSRSHVS